MIDEPTLRRHATDYVDRALAIAKAIVSPAKREEMIERSMRLTGWKPKKKR